MKRHDGKEKPPLPGPYLVAVLQHDDEIGAKFLVYDIYEFSQDGEWHPDWDSTIDQGHRVRMWWELPSTEEEDA